MEKGGDLSAVSAAAFADGRDVAAALGVAVLAAAVGVAVLAVAVGVAVLAVAVGVAVLAVASGGTTNDLRLDGEISVTSFAFILGVALTTVGVAVVVVVVVVVETLMGRIFVAWSACDIQVDLIPNRTFPSGRISLILVLAHCLCVSLQNSTFSSITYICPEGDTTIILAGATTLLYEPESASP
jgi:hypothetical protein